MSEGSSGLPAREKGMILEGTSEESTGLNDGHEGRSNEPATDGATDIDEHTRE